MMNSSPVIERTVAFVSNNCWSLYNFRRQVLMHFLQKGYRVLAIATADEYVDEITGLGCVYYPVDFRNSSVDPMSDLRLFSVLRKIYQSEKPGIIFHFVTKPCIYGSMVAGKLGIPSIAVITGLGYVFAGRKWLRYPVRFLFRKALVSAREVWFLNKENAAFFVNQHIIAEGKSRILPGEGIDTSWFFPKPKHSPQNRFIFLMVSRLLWSKGLGIYIDAAKILREKGVQAEFRLLGKPEAGHPESVSTEQLNTWEKEGLIINLGFTNDVRMALSDADCLVLPTYYEEGIPRTLLEACSMEIPCISTDQTGSHTVIEDGINGLLCKPRNPSDLAEKMQHMILLGAEKRNQMGKQGRDKMIRQFEMSTVISIYEKSVNHYLTV
jgi:glycosyltransferase involved in cell wall biosynthesis